MELKSLRIPPKREGWIHGKFFELLHAVKEWQRLPSELGLCEPEQDLLFMAAYEEVVAEMKSFEEYKAELKRKEREAIQGAKGKTGKRHI